MTAVIPSAIEAEDIVQAMLEDGVFAEEMWSQIAEALHKGMLLDNLMDQINSDGFDGQTLRKIEAAFRMISDMCTDKLEA